MTSVEKNEGGMLAALSDKLDLKAILSAFRPEVAGKPPWVSQYLAQGLCRIKWLCAAGIVVWFVQAAGLLSGSARRLYVEPASRTGISPEMLIYSCIAIGVAGALVALGTGRYGVTVAGARRLVAAVATSTISAEALLFGFSAASFERVASFDLALLIVLAIVPLGILACAVLTVMGLVLAGVSALASGLVVSSDRSLLLTVLVVLLHPASFAVLAIVANRWYLGRFKTERLAQLRLMRHARTLERQKRQIEDQRNETLRQSAEITRQRAVLLHALSSALTTPVAQAYTRDGRFPSALKTVCVIACDAVGFSDTCKNLQPERVVSELENFFRKFDAACLKCRVEPLRAQGDSRIAIAGLWSDGTRPLHQEVISAVLAMLYFKASLPGVEGHLAMGGERSRVLWPARIGICLGPASCGVIDTGEADESGTTGRLWFDVWGDTVNLAARLQQAAQPNQLLVRESVLWEACGLFDYGPFGQIQVKSTTVSDAAEVFCIRQPFRDELGMPNEAFWNIFNDASAQPLRPNPAGTVPKIGEAKAVTR